MRLITHYPRKINLGCGYDYLQGYLNVDFFNTAVADVKMSATALNLPHNYFAEILLKDIIEHFGYCDSLVILAKCYLLLKPGGVLVITTPDIEKAFRQYNSAASLEDKENILCHVYGIEDAGMTHKFCFPLPFLENLLAKSGFTVTKREFFENIVFRPTMTVLAKKIDDDFFEKRNMLITTILKNKEIRISYADFSYFETIVDSFLKVTNLNNLRDFVKQYGHISPRLLLFLLKTNQLMVDKSTVKKIIKELQKLIKKFDRRYFSDFSTKEADYKVFRYTEALRNKNTKIIR
ncbi:MAG: hypothetical protein LBD99_05750 [Candidatus Margulisbacteria bacterium]|jgi:hypothetical protein|nr:hypothetical protein [Candidatus Margulisiibacteriota bacterium]